VAAGRLNAVRFGPFALRSSASLGTCQSQGIAGVDKLSPNGFFTLTEQNCVKPCKPALPSLLPEAFASAAMCQWRVPQANCHPEPFSNPRAK
jgi:hypothetical protein